MMRGKGDAENLEVLRTCWKHNIRDFMDDGTSGSL